MEVRQLTCSRCRAELPIAYSTGADRQPCENCGGTSITVAVQATATAHASATASYVVQTTNAAGTRRLRLQAELDELETQVSRNSLADCQVTLKRALEALHELDDCLKAERMDAERVDGATSWVFGELTLGARNVAHHSSHSVTALRSDADADERLYWDIDGSALGGLHSTTQQNEYTARLHGHGVLPPLRLIVARVAASVPYSRSLLPLGTQRRQVRDRGPDGEPTANRTT